MMSMETKLSHMLSSLLLKKNLTLKQLANETGIKPSTLSGWKNGVSPRDLSEVRRCAQFFGVSMEMLLFGQQNEEVSLDSLLTEKVFDGFLKVKIERIIKK